MLKFLEKKHPAKLFGRKSRKNMYLDWKQSGSLPENMDLFPVDL
jgi:hypothetical protein